VFINWLLRKDRKWSPFEAKCMTCGKIRAISLRRVRMALIEWDETFSVKVAGIDKQHQKLVSMTNELHDAMKQGKGKSIMSNIIIELINYTKTHFQTEEKYFEEFGYPEKDSHKKEHSDFVNKVKEFKNDFDNGKLGLSIEIMSFLSNWLRNHIKGTDKKYSKFFNEKGLK